MSIKVVLVLVFCAARVNSLPSILRSFDADDKEDKNVIGAPVNCPEGQLADANGECRDVWRILDDFESQNIIGAPVNCPDGQLADANGVCRPVWRGVGYQARERLRNIIGAPVNCPEGQLADANGVCRPVWRYARMNPKDSGMEESNIITAPVNCPEGQMADANGVCRDVWYMIIAEFLKLTENNAILDSGIEESNIITAPINCPDGELADANGVCRPVWMYARSNTIDSGIEGSNIITAPVNCPEGQLADANGTCRDVWYAIIIDLINSMSYKEREVSENKGNESNFAINRVTREVLGERNIINVPNQCPEGQQLDANGKCRDVWRRR